MSTRVKAFLRAQTGVDLPGNVARTLDEWQAQHQRIVLRPAVTLVHGPAELLSVLAAARPRWPRTWPAAPRPKCCGWRAPPALRRWLRPWARRAACRWSPRSRPCLPTPCWPMRPGRCVCSPAAPTSTCTAGWPPLPSPAGEAAYQISAASMGRRDEPACGARPRSTAWPASSRAAAGRAGAPPARLAKHYGDAAAESVVLLQVRDAATLAELSADPGASRCSSPSSPRLSWPWPASAPKSLATLRARLAERGMDLKPKLE